MSVIDIDELHQDTAAILRRVRDQSEPIAISQNGEIIARITPVEPARVSPVAAVQLETVDPNATHAAIWAELTRLGQELAETWPDGLSAVEAIREQRRY